MNKRESRGLIIFSSISLLVLLIGIVMKILGQVAYGHLGASRYYGPAWISLTGNGVIILGILMLSFGLILYFMVQNEKNS